MEGKAARRSGGARRRRGAAAAPGSAGEGGEPARREGKKKGVEVSLEEVRAAFSFLDSGGKGFLTKHDLQEKLPLFYKNLKPKEYQYLMNKKSKLSVEELHALLAENELTHYDPVAEAFQFYDPEGTGFIDPNVLRTLLEHLGLGTVTDEDLATLVAASDVDGDGFIGLEDFRAMMDKGPAAFDITRPAAEQE